MPSVFPELVEAPLATAKPKVGFVSLGCPKNLVDSEVMMGILHHNGAELTAKAEDSDIIVINTCSFIDSAKQESVNTILEMVKHKVEGRAQRIIVAGCLVERYRDEIRANIPEVDAVVGTGELDAILLAAGLAPAQPSDSPFNILPQSLVSRAPSAVHQHSHPTEGGSQLAFRAEGDARVSSPVDSPAHPGTAQPPRSPNTSTPTKPRAFCRHLAHPPTSRSPKAATIPAPSASSRSSAASSARAASVPSSRRPRTSSPRASARSPSSARTPPATAKTSA